MYRVGIGDKKECTLSFGSAHPTRPILSHPALRFCRRTNDANSLIREPRGNVVRFVRRLVVDNDDFKVRIAKGL